MNQLSSSVAPFLLYGILFVIGVNFFISLFLSYFSKIKSIKLVFYYWGALLGSYLFQGLVPTGNLPVILGFATSIVPVCIASKILFDSLKRNTPFLRYGIIFTIGIIASSVLSLFNLSFTTLALPVSIVLIVPLLEPSLFILHFKRKETSVLQKFMSFQYIMSAVHVINFAIFRMEDGTQVIGFGVALLLYQAMSISLLAFSLEEYSKEEKNRLQEQVEERTKDLSFANISLQNALSVKEMLFKVVLHDIANPISAQSMLLDLVEKSGTTPQNILPKLNSLNSLVVAIIKKVRTLAPLDGGRVDLKLEAVSLPRCIESVQLIFKEALLKKNITLVFENNLPEETCFVADQTAFTTSVINNLISNSIKFSDVGTEILVRSFEKNGRIIIEVEDKGIGMKQEALDDIFNPLKIKSTIGTDGEIGTGYGLSLVKFYVNNFKGFIKVESKSKEEHPDNHGTKFTINLEKSS